MLFLETLRGKFLPSYFPWTAWSKCMISMASCPTISAFISFSPSLTPSSLLWSSWHLITPKTSWICAHYLGAMRTGQHSPGSSLGLPGLWWSSSLNKSCFIEPHDSSCYQLSFTVRFSRPFLFMGDFCTWLTVFSLGWLLLSPEDLWLGLKVSTHGFPIHSTVMIVILNQFSPHYGPILVLTRNLKWILLFSTHEWLRFSVFAFSQMLSKGVEIHPLKLSCWYLCYAGS